MTPTPRSPAQATRAIIAEGAELGRLRVRVRELEEELEEWQRQGTAPEIVGDTLIWGRALGMRPQAANLVMHLCQAPGHFLSRWYIHDAIVGKGETTNIVNVAVCHARNALKALGLTGIIISGYGQGYMITREGARQVRALVEG